MAELETAPDRLESCCSTAAQESCCAPDDKGACCGPEHEAGSCGCSAGDESGPGQSISTV
jgi:hypothetical protein